ncbi:cytosine permease [Streptomyces vietnamensis]|uniref:Cobalamin biosynthesis protein n=1 Tax=Streptomyces vietnamensis TaxID=362257 RepID=A0A0B5IEF7_9ACTN|nr:cytosine permease [Streptomyces vietnamensis]AJF68108.1 cobalamin biosynthesis protein [Streptomyces vietnamensis]
MNTHRTSAEEQDSPAGSSAGSPADASAGRELDPEYEHSPVPAHSRKSLLTVSAVWFGFPMILTNAVPGGVVVALLGFWRGLAAIAVANLVMLLYVGILSHRAGTSGESFSLQATRTFGRTGYIVASAFLATIVVGWFAFNTGATGATLHQAFGWHEQLVALLAGLGFIALTYLGIKALSWLGAVAAPLFLIAGITALVIVAKDHDLGAVFSYEGVGGGASLTFGAAVSMIMATFADSGTMTADFTRWSKNGRQAVLATVSAFPVASVIAQVTGGLVVAAGAVAMPATAGGDFLPILTGQGSSLLDVLAAVFVFVNLGSVCSHCLYNGALGWSHLTGRTMRLMTVVLGVVGTVAALAGVWNHFLDWLVILSVFVPPLGGVLIADQFFARGGRGAMDRRPTVTVRPTAFLAWAVGAAGAGLAHWFAPQLSDAVTGLVVAIVAYAVLERVVSRPSEAVGAAGATAG